MDLTDIHVTVNKLETYRLSERSVVQIRLLLCYVYINDIKLYIYASRYCRVLYRFGDKI